MSYLTVTRKGIQDSYAQLPIESKTADCKILLSCLCFVIERSLKIDYCTLELVKSHYHDSIVISRVKNCWPYLRYEMAYLKETCSLH